MNQARLETESYETMFQHLGSIKREIELNGLANPETTFLTGIHQINISQPVGQ